MPQRKPGSESAPRLALPRSEQHVFAPVDFERETLDAGLASVGFDPSAPTLFSWLAVMPYLTLDAIEATLRGLAAVDHLDRDGLRERYLGGRTDVPPPYTTERVLTAAVPRRAASAGKNRPMGASWSCVRTGLEGAITPAGADTAVARRSANPAVRLQRKIGNRATGHLLARAPATKNNGTVQIGKLPAIKIGGGNASEWAVKKELRTLEIASTKGRHSAALERLSEDGSKIPLLKVTTPIVDQNGQHLDFGSVELEFSHVTIADYEVDGKVETWRAVDFNRVHRTTISHRTGI